MSSPLINWVLENASNFQLFLVSWATLGRYLLHGTYMMIAMVLISFSFGWLFWLLLSLSLTVVQLVYAFYLFLGISVDVTTISVFNFITKVFRIVSGLFKTKDKKRKKVLDTCKTYDSYQHLSELDDDKSINREWKSNTVDYSNASLLIKTTTRLSLARAERRLADLQFLLSGVLKRDYLGIHSEELHNKITNGTKDCVEAFQCEVERCLNALVEADESELPMQQKLAFFKKERRSLGQSALCLSGGGSICMYHIGVMKGLMDADLFKHINVFSGASGGSIIAGAIAMMNENELKEFVIHPSVATDFKHDGSQKATGSYYFPSLSKQFFHFIRHGVLMDRNEFKKTCDYYYGDLTFAEAYARTKRHVSISVTGDGTGSRLLLNHIASPHVTLASAVAASCALPAIMLAQPLEAKDATGQVVSFDVDGTDYVDGSIGADLPFKRMSTLFNVSSFFVSQVNFHVSPFMHKGGESPNKTSYYWGLLKFCEEDLRHRARKLAKLGVLPTFFGVSMSSMVKQKYHGDVTMVPSLSPIESIGLKAIMNPTPKHMLGYIAGGERTAWPHVNRIRFMMRTEICLRLCVAKLRKMLLERPKTIRDESHLLQMQSLKSETSLATLANAIFTSSSSDTPPCPSSSSSPGRPHTVADEFGLLSDDEDVHQEDDEEDEEDEEEAREGERKTNQINHNKTPISFPFPIAHESPLKSPRAVQRRKGGVLPTHKNKPSSKSQLNWELNIMSDQITSLRNENIELRTRLSNISSLAEFAVSRSPKKSPANSPPMTRRRKNTCPY